MKKVLMTLLLVFSFNASILAYSESVILGGDNIGIKVNTDGILITGFYKINNKYLNKDNLKIGDYIISVGDEKINDIDEFNSLINEYIKDNKVSIKVLRNNNIINETLYLNKTNDGYKTGIYAKDSLTGIGTLTYIDPLTGVYGALGHEILESSSKELVIINDGTIYDSEVTSINKSVDGEPGSKNASIEYEDVLGNIKTNTISGIYGTFKGQNASHIKAVPVPAISGSGKISTHYRAYAVCKGAKNPEGAGYFLRYFLDPYNYNWDDIFLNEDAKKVFVKYCGGADFSTKAVGWSLSGTKGILGATDWEGIYAWDNTINRGSSSQVNTTLSTLSSQVDDCVKKTNQILSELK